MARWLGGVVVVAVALALPASAQHDPVEAVGQAYERGELTDAIALAERALRAGGLSLPQVGRLLELQVLSALALGRDGRADDALRIMAVVTPDHELSSEAPPRVRDDLDRLRTSTPTPQLDSTAELTPGGARITAQSNAPPEVRPRIRIFVRVDRGAWQRFGDRAELSAPAGTQIEWYAELLSLGGVRLATEGSVAGPHELQTPRQSSPSPLGLGLGIGLGAAVAVAAAVGAVVLVRRGGPSETRVQTITVRWGD